MGEETMRITVVGWLMIAAVVVAAVLLMRHLANQNKPNAGPEQNPAEEEGLDSR